MKMIPIIIIVITLILTIGTCGYKMRTSSGSTTQASSGLPLSHSYSLTMRQESGRQFDKGKSLTYRIRDDEGQEIVLTCYDSGGLFGAPLHATIQFDPHTLRGTWTYNLGGVVQGGAIHLNTTTHGFEFKVTNDFGPYAGSPPGYGQLIALP